MSSATSRPPGGGTNRLTRVVWLLFALLFAGPVLAGLPARYQELSQPCLGAGCPVLHLTPVEAELLAGIGLSPPHYALFDALLGLWLALFYLGVALLIFLRNPGDRFALLVSLTLVAVGSTFQSEADSALVRQIEALALPVALVNAAAFVLILLLIFLFPSGRVVPRWSALPLLLGATALIVDPLLPLGSLLVSGVASSTALAVLLGGLLLGAAMQIYRYRRVSTSTERQQTKWVLVGLIATLIPILAWSLAIEIFPLAPGRGRLLFLTLGMGLIGQFFLVLPLSLLFSIQRYRLWEIDRVINRALVYTLVTGALAALYFGSVILLQALFRAISGQGSTLAVVLSTLASALLFQPLRARVQRWVDRRFYRRRYNAERMLADFAATARSEVALEPLSDELVEVIEQAMQPSFVSLWFRGDWEGGERGEGVRG